MAGGRTDSGGKQNHAGIYFKCIYKRKGGGIKKKKTPSVFLLGHVREPLAKIIIYEGKERRREQGAGQ